MAAPIPRKLKKGELLFNEGDISKSMYFIQTGTIRLFKKKGNASIELGVIHKGEVIGEMGFQLKDYLFSSGTYAGQVRGGNTSWSFGYPSYSFGSTYRPLNTKTYAPGVEFGGLTAFRSDHATGVNFLFADGSAHFIRESIHADTYRALGTRAAGDFVEDY